MVLPITMEKSNAHLKVTGELSQGEVLTLRMDWVNEFNYDLCFPMEVIKACGLTSWYLCKVFSKFPSDTLPTLGGMWMDLTGSLALWLMV